MHLPCFFITAPVYRIPCRRASPKLKNRGGQTPLKEADLFAVSIPLPLRGKRCRVSGGERHSVKKSPFRNRLSPAGGNGETKKGEQQANLLQSFFRAFTLRMISAASGAMGAGMEPGRASR